mmetsp:Transcript_29358/g.44305  ORF Transcript_29358/g.44305 Transcript_29358/m.44305 type:complete len:89 (-) Transcript_29358:1581-1847(-)
MYQYSKLVARHEQVEFFMSALSCLQELERLEPTFIKKSSILFYMWKIETCMGNFSAAKFRFLTETEKRVGQSTKIYTGDASTKKIMTV